MEQITLNNNLPIFHLKSSNLGEQVNITVWFRVGSRNDKEGKFGAAHLIEHSMLRILINKNIDLKEYLLKNALEYKILTSIDFILLRFICTKTKSLTILHDIKKAFDEVKIKPDVFNQEKALVENEIAIKMGTQSKQYFDTLRENIWSSNLGHPILGNSLDIQSINVREITDIIQWLWNKKKFFVLYTGDLSLQQFQITFNPSVSSVGSNHLTDFPLVPAKKATIRKSSMELNIPEYTTLNVSLIYPLENKVMEKNALLMTLLSRLIAFGDMGFLSKALRTGESPLYYVMAFPFSFQFENVLIVNFIAKHEQVSQIIDSTQTAIHNLNSNLEKVSQYFDIVKKGFVNDISKAQRSDFDAMNYIGQALIYNHRVNRLSETTKEINSIDIEMIENFSKTVFSTDQPMYFIAGGEEMSYE